MKNLNLYQFLSDLTYIIDMPSDRNEFCLKFIDNTLQHTFLDIIADLGPKEKSELESSISSEPKDLHKIRQLILGYLPEDKLRDAINGTFKNAIYAYVKDIEDLLDDEKKLRIAKLLETL